MSTLLVAWTNWWTNTELSWRWFETPWRSCNVTLMILITGHSSPTGHSDECLPTHRAGPDLRSYIRAWSGLLPQHRAHQWEVSRLLVQRCHGTQERLPGEGMARWRQRQLAPKTIHITKTITTALLAEILWPYQIDVYPILPFSLGFVVRDKERSRIHVWNLFSLAKALWKHSEDTEVISFMGTILINPSD